MLVRYFKAKVKHDNPRFKVLLKLCEEGCAGVKNKQTKHYRKQYLALLLSDYYTFL